MAHEEHQGNVAEPPYATPVVSEKTGLIRLPWLNFFRNIAAGKAGAFIELGDDFPVAPDVVVYTASIPGSIFIQGGAFNAVTLTRGRLTLDVSSALGTFIPMNLGDQVSMDYTVLPDAVTFIPSIGVQQGVM